MNTREFLTDLFEDDDTYKVLDITGHFMEQYFGHSEEQARALMAVFFAELGSSFDEDMVHHESAYRVATIIHYLQYLKGDPGLLDNWMFESGTNQPPPEAAAYFHEHYSA